MKTKVLLLLLTAHVTLLQAQTNGDNKKKKIDFQVALTGGLLYSSLPGDYGSSGSKAGGQFGASATILDLSQGISVRGELVYSMQGDKSKYEGDDYDYSSSDQTSLNYLNLPLTAHYQHRSGFFAEAGLQPGFLLSAKNKYTVTGGGTGGSSGTDDIKGSLKKFDLGLPFGVGYTFKKKISVGIRVVRGIMNINKDKGEYATSVHNFTTALRASYIF